MGALSSAAMLALWERGTALQPLERTLALYRAAVEDAHPPRNPDVPLGAVNIALLELRRETFGSQLAAQTDCERCRTRLEFTLNLDEVLAGLEASGNPDGADAACSGLRAPTLRDLAAVAETAQVEEAAQMLLQRCSRGQPGVSPLSWEEAERCLELLDPAADIGVALRCDQCGHDWLQSLDVAALLWEELSACATGLIADVHRLAQAYGWSERDILALAPQRRAAYLELCGQ